MQVRTAEMPRRAGRAILRITFILYLLLFAFSSAWACLWPHYEYPAYGRLIDTVAWVASITLGSIQVIRLNPLATSPRACRYFYYLLIAIAWAVVLPSPPTDVFRVTWYRNQLIGLTVVTALSGWLSRRTPGTWSTVFVFTSISLLALYVYSSLMLYGTPYVPAELHSPFADSPI